MEKVLFPLFGLERNAIICRHAGTNYEVFRSAIKKAFADIIKQYPAVSSLTGGEEFVIPLLLLPCPLTPVKGQSGLTIAAER